MSVSAEQQNIEAGKNESLMEEIAFEREYIAVNIQKIKELMESKEAKTINVDAFNAELVNILSDIKKQTENNQDWRGDMYRNIASISEYLITATKVMSSSVDDKAKQISELNKIILEFEICGESIAELNDQKKRRDIYEGLTEIQKQFNKSIKMLNNYKSGIN